MILINHKNAFTLVELLVVIAIIGILSGLIIVGMNSSVQSANIAKAQVFSASLKDSMLMNLVSEWKFDGTGVNDGSNATTAYTQDTWGSNNCTIGGTPLAYSGTNCIYGSCLKFNGTTDYLDCGTASNLDLTTAFTIESWINPTTLTSVNKPWFSKSNYLLTRITSSWQTDVYWYLLKGGSQQEGTAGFKLNVGKWNHLVQTYDSQTHYLKFYLDGVLKFSNTMNSPYAIDDNLSSSFWIARYGSEYFNASMDNFRVYNTATPAFQVRQNYYFGINKILAENQILEKEYRQKILELDNKIANN